MLECSINVKVELYYEINCILNSELNTAQGDVKGEGAMQSV